MVCLVEASPRTPATITDIPLATGKRLRTVTGTVAELIAARADFGDDYLRVVVQEPVRAGLRDEVLEALPQALEIRIHPDFAQTRTHRGVQHTTRSPRDLFAAYCDEAGLQDPRLTALFSELLDETTGVS